MPNTPAEAKFLTEEEQILVIMRLKVDSHGSVTKEDINDEHFSWYWVKMAVKAPQTWILSLAWFFHLVSLYVCYILTSNVLRN